VLNREKTTGPNGWQVWLELIQSLMPRQDDVAEQIAQYQAIAHAKAVLSPPGFRLLRDKLGLKSPEVTKRIGIARKANLFIRFAKNVPPVLSTQYELRGLDDSVFEGLIAAKLIHRNLTAREARHIADSYRHK
jgi:hypothetical protein